MWWDKAKPIPQRPRDHMTLEFVVWRLRQARFNEDLKAFDALIHGYVFDDNGATPKGE
jgi:hypothetical protein